MDLYDWSPWTQNSNCGWRQHSYFTVLIWIVCTLFLHTRNPKMSFLLASFFLAVSTMARSVSNPTRIDCICFIFFSTMCLVEAYWTPSPIKYLNAHSECSLIVLVPTDHKPAQKFRMQGTQSVLPIFSITSCEEQSSVSSWAIWTDQGLEWLSYLGSTA